MRRLIYAPLSWYDATPSGRIISRLTADFGIIDQKLAQDMDTLLQMVSMVVTIWFYICATSWALAIVGLAVAVIFCGLTSSGQPAEDAEMHHTCNTDDKKYKPFVVTAPCAQETRSLVVNVTARS